MLRLAPAHRARVMRAAPEAKSCRILLLHAHACKVEGRRAQVAAAQPAAQSSSAHRVSWLARGGRARLGLAAHRLGPLPASQAALLVRKVTSGALAARWGFGPAPTAGRRVGHILAHLVVVLAQHAHLAHARHLNG